MLPFLLGTCQASGKWNDYVDYRGEYFCARAFNHAPNNVARSLVAQFPGGYELNCKKGIISIWK